MTPEERAAIVAESTRRMVAGIPLLDRGGWVAALEHFDAAVELRGRLPWREDGEAAWLLAAAWLNRSDALRGLGFLPEAIGSLDRCIEAMGSVPLAENPLHVERLILAWINRGTACGEVGDAAAALDGFEAARRLIDAWELTPRRIFLAAMLRANRARVLLENDRAKEGREEARGAVDILRQLEPTAEVAAAGIKARSLECRALAMLLDEPGGAATVGDWIAEATDAVEEALVLVKAAGFRDGWAGDLVRYGARIYRVCQPQFLGEFLAEWLGVDGPLVADELLKREMRNELLLARAEVERKVLLLPQETEFVGKQIRILKSLQAGEAAF
jgi:tetratricopeptide (TPR) repeat protein